MPRPNSSLLPETMHTNHPIPAIDSNWTLLLDRDGVINRQKEGSYIFHPGEFDFLPDVVPAMATLSRLFSTILVITNQRGVGKGLMTESDLHNVHAYMQQQVAQGGGRIDGIYYCTDTEAESPCRKPNTGMAQQAIRDFPECDFTRSVMIGNSMSDMHFGRNVGAYTIFITSTHPQVQRADAAIDAVFDSLAAATRALLAASQPENPAS